MQLGLRSSGRKSSMRSSTGSGPTMDDSSKTGSSSNNGTSTSRKSRSEFLAQSMKEMDPQKMIELLEMYGQSSEGDNHGFDCLQSIKNSSQTSMSSLPEVAPPKKHKKSKKSSNFSKAA
ncbi:expressed unknown protein [Seminavis robusta]|uniref:Uncharacterized protein n=1 Tax=Seminavis robusta TaxID=568900 RepID=A0A9N8ECA7_9STRA|nr:expressed unknown protein [Seminavis robusta]|eukprot:Sro914_g219520.1 n/a (119) ;mRNA; r:3260-3616